MSAHLSGPRFSAPASADIAFKHCTGGQWGGLSLRSVRRRPNRLIPCNWHRLGPLNDHLKVSGSAKNLTACVRFGTGKLCVSEVGVC